MENLKVWKGMKDWDGTLQRYYHSISELDDIYFVATGQKPLAWIETLYFPFGSTIDGIRTFEEDYKITKRLLEVINHSDLQVLVFQDAKKKILRYIFFKPDNLLNALKFYYFQVVYRSPYSKGLLLGYPLENVMAFVNREIQVDKETMIEKSKQLMEELDEIKLELKGNELLIEGTKEIPTQVFDKILYVRTKVDLEITRREFETGDTPYIGVEAKFKNQV